MSSVVSAGALAPDFVLPNSVSGEAVALQAQRGNNVVLLFFPASIGQELSAQLATYQALLPRFVEQQAIVLGISDAPDDVLRTQAIHGGIAFPLLSDTRPLRATAAKYGVVDMATSTVLPTVFIIDATGVIRRVYDPTARDQLPNPAAVVRSLIRLTNTPVPAPVNATDWQRGVPDAPVVLIEYSDYQCAHCGELHRVLESVLPRYGDQVLLVHRHLPLRQRHPLAQLAAEVAEAAGAQGKFWEMHHRLFEEGDSLERERLIQIAQELSLDVERFVQDLDSHRFAEAVNEDFKGAVQRGIKLPPALFVNNIPWEGARTAEAICAKIKSLLSGSSDRAPSFTPTDSDQ